MAWGIYQPRGIGKAAFSIQKLNFLSKSARRHLRRIFHPNDIYDIDFPGFKMRCYVGDNATERDIVFGGKYDNKVELAAIIGNLSANNVFVDIGANCGLFSLSAAQKMGPEGRVIAIEPNPIMIERLRFNVSANNFQNIEIFECAIGKETSNMQLQICEKEMGRSGFNVGVTGPIVSVKTRPLTDVLTDCGISYVDAMKIDVEGYEDQVIIPFLRTASNTLWPRSLLLEISSADRWQEDCVSYLLDHGYRVAWEAKTDVFLRREV